MAETQDNKPGAVRLAQYRFYLRKRPVMLGLLSLAAVLFFLFVTGLSRAYYAQQQALGDRWFNRGVNDLKAKRFSSAVTDFRAALLYSRDNYTYQLNLAEALLGEKRTGEASAYFLNLWDRQPEDGLVNLELARISVERGETDKAARYYHDAVYAAWPSDQETLRRTARLELIELLLGTNSEAQAQAELIALAANAGEDAPLQEHVGDLFLRAHDDKRALAAFQVALKENPQDQTALAGAGKAAFELQRYELARRYFHEVVAENPNDTKTAEQLKLAESVLDMDPFRPEISVAERDRIVEDAFRVAGQRLKHCAASMGATAPESQPTLGDSWTALQPKISAQGLRRNPDLAREAMNLVFEIEHDTSTTCGAPTGPDMALLLIARLHEGS